MDIEIRHYDNYKGGGATCYVNKKNNRECSATGWGLSLEGIVLHNVMEYYFDFKTPSEGGAGIRQMIKEGAEVGIEITTKESTANSTFYSVCR